MGKAGLAIDERSVIVQAVGREELTNQLAAVLVEGLVKASLFYHFLPLVLKPPPPLHLVPAQAESCLAFALPSQAPFRLHEPT